jgi:predicted lysophospholipase L1 biosynthesis ABC-type transport system permease subunit
MLLKGILCDKTANMEEYKAKRRRRTYVYLGMAVLGVLTLLFDFLAVPRLVPQDTPFGGFSKGLYLGAGAALIACGGMMAYRNLRSLKDEALLKRLRAEEEDERSRAIASRATFSAAIVTMVILYLVLVVAGVFSPMLVLFCIGVVVVFFVCELAFQCYYGHKM